MMRISTLKWTTMFLLTTLTIGQTRDDGDVDLNLTETIENHETIEQNITNEYGTPDTPIILTVANSTQMNEESISTTDVTAAPDNYVEESRKFPIDSTVLTRESENLHFQINNKSELNSWRHNNNHAVLGKISERNNGNENGKWFSENSHSINNSHSAYAYNNSPEVKEKSAGDVEGRGHLFGYKKEVENAAQYGLMLLKELVEIKEPLWYKMGLFLDKDDPASHAAKFGQPANERAIKLSRFGYAALEASQKLTETLPGNGGRQATGLPEEFKSRLLMDECPLRGRPRCTPTTRRYRTADGTCNNFRHPWRGSAMLPMQRFLPPVYEDGIQSIRRSITGSKLPSTRDISIRVHRDRNVELPTATLMFMQWGQFLDHDIISTVKTRSFNGSIPRCCDRGGREVLPPELLHPACAPIEVSDDDWFLGQFGVRCLEFLRSAPSARIDCDLGWREQINQVTSFIDGSTIYGSDIETADFMRTFKNGKLQYGRPRGPRPLQPPDPPGGELCRSGALISECFDGGDGRFSEQPGLIAIHTTWLRYHNKMADVLSQMNNHWTDEKVYQETRKIIGALIQHITYREYLPILLGQEVIQLFELDLARQGFYNNHDDRINPAVANSFATAAFRFGHSMVPNTYIRTDSEHRPIFNNVSLHSENENFENIWSLGSVDRILLGFCNQASQRRDEFICDELTNHLFQSPGFLFGMDLTAINIQRGRDHGIPPYTMWREPCGLSLIETWKDLEKIMAFETVQRFKSLYQHVDDIDLFSGGLAEKPVRGGIVGPTFACIIAQQFLNLRKADRFWYENGGFGSSFTPAQLQEIRHVTYASILCNTMDEIKTLQPFVFLTADKLSNQRLSCNSPFIDNFDLTPWLEDRSDEIDNSIESKKFREKAGDEINLNLNKQFLREGRDDDCRRKKKRRRPPNVIPNRVRTTTRRPTTVTTVRPIPSSRPNRRTTTQKPFKIKITNVTTNTVSIQDKNHGYGDIPGRPAFSYYRPTRPYDDIDDVTYLLGLVNKAKPTQKPLEVNIKIQYYPPVTSTTPKTLIYYNKRRPALSGYQENPSTLKPNGYFPIYVNVDDDVDDERRKPGVSYANDRLDYKKPLAANAYSSNPVTFVRPLYSFSEYMRPQENIRTTTKKTYVIKPVKYDYNSLYNLQGSQLNQQSYGNQIYSSTRRPQVQQSGYSNGYSGGNSNKYSSENSDLYSNGNANGYSNGNSNSYFNSNLNGYSNGNSHGYPNVNSNEYSNSYSNGYSNFYSPTRRPSYKQEEQKRFSNFPIDKDYQTYDKIDTTEDTLLEYLDDSGKVYDQIAEDKIRKPTKLYSIGNVHRISNEELEESLDFKTKFLLKRRRINSNRNASPDFVKISSVKADFSIGTGEKEVEFHASQREGDMDLYELDNETTKESDNKKTDIKLLEIDVIPSEIREHQWVMYNASKEIMPLIIIPDMTLGIASSEETPRPMDITKNFKKTNSTRML